MTRPEAFNAMQNGSKVTHRHFADGEYYLLDGGDIIAEDGVDHTETFWGTDGQDWRKDGWEIFNDNKK